jgi:hypothetical protein
MDTVLAPTPKSIPIAFWLEPESKRSSMLDCRASRPSSGYARELVRLTGVLRAPTWLGRNRLSLPSPTSAPNSASAGPFVQLAGEPSVPLRSMIDDMVDAVAAGDFKFLITPGVLSAFNAMLVELKNPLLVPDGRGSVLYFRGRQPERHDSGHFGAQYPEVHQEPAR